jgi:uncharacterized membrane protein YgcG
MDRAAAIAAESLVYLARVFPEESEFRKDVKKMLDHLDKIWEDTQKQQHALKAAMIENATVRGGSISPCPCGDCAEDEGEDLKDAIRAAVLMDIEGSPAQSASAVSGGCAASSGVSGGGSARPSGGAGDTIQHC